MCIVLSNPCSLNLIPKLRSQKINSASFCTTYRRDFRGQDESQMDHFGAHEQFREVLAAAAAAAVFSLQTLRNKESVEETGEEQINSIPTIRKLTDRLLDLCVISQILH